MNILEDIKNQITNNKVVLYMKGTPQFPMCGFSSKVVKILQLLKVRFVYINILENIQIRKMLPKYSDWPTFPQLYINGELIGGCDIVSELYEDNSLKEKLEDIKVLEKEESISFSLN
jgi:monothiol glutaredoxin